jgi:hypothetical protein
MQDENVTEPVTTRSELCSWYFYYFGNNSAGTLSYAPLSLRNPHFLALSACWLSSVFQSLLGKLVGMEMNSVLTAQSMQLRPALSNSV